MMLRQVPILILYLEIMTKALNLKLVIVKEYQNIWTFFAIGYTANWTEGVFAIKKIKNTISSAYVIQDRNGEEIVGTFYKKELQKTNQTEIRAEKAKYKKENKLSVKWKG